MAPMMLGVAVAGSIATGVIGAVGAMQEADATNQAAQYNASIQDYNRKVSERNKITTLQQADAEAADLESKNRRTLSSIRAAYGASGLQLTGSTLDVMEDTAIEQQLDVSRVRYKGQLTAIGYDDEASNFAAKAQLERMKGESALQAGKIKAIGSVVSGVTNAASMFYKGRAA